MPGPRINWTVKGTVSAWVILILFSVLTACQSAPPAMDPDLFLSSLNLQNPAQRTSTENLSAQDVQEDMDFLLHALQRVYGGWDFLKPSFRKKVSQEIEGIRQATTRHQLEKRLENLSLFTEHKDGHLGLVKPLVIKDPQNVSTRAVRRYLKRKRFWDLEFKNLQGRDVLWISLYEFPFIENNPEWNRFLKELAKTTERADEIVLDLRINPGGALVSALALAKIFSSGRPLSDLGDSYHILTPEAKVGRYYQLGQGTSDIDLASWRENTRAITYPIDASAYEKIEVPFISIHQPVLILTSPYCASSCEVLALLLQHHPRFMVAGQHTAGIFHFHTPIQVRLPHSGILLALPTGVLRLRDGQFLELKGLPPQFPISNLAEAEKYVSQGFRSIQMRRTSF